MPHDVVYRGAKSRIYAGGTVLVQHQIMSISDEDYNSLRGRDKQDVVILISWNVPGMKLAPEKVDPPEPPVLKGESEFDNESS